MLPSAFVCPCRSPCPAVCLLSQIEGVMNDFVRLREESSYLEMGMLLEGGNGLNDLMADDEDNYQVGESCKLT